MRNMDAVRRMVRKSRFLKGNYLRCGQTRRDLCQIRKEESNRNIYTLYKKFA